MKCNLMILGLLILSLPHGGLAEDSEKKLEVGLKKYTSTENASLSKFQRITEVESFLAKLTPTLEKVTSRVNKYGEKISKLTKEFEEFKNQEKSSEEVEKLRADLDSLKQSLGDFEYKDFRRLKEDVEELKERDYQQIESQLKNVTKSLGAVRKVLEEMKSAPPVR